MNVGGQIAPTNGFAMALAEAAEALGARREGADVALRGVCTDTRRLQPGQLFVALQGPNFDGHDFVPAALEAGAAACLVSRPVASPAIVVEDTRRALGELARAWRQRFRLPLIAVTGSNGKTTVKEMLAAILASGGPILATRGNLNNDIGVPLTLFELDGAHRAAVVEMGANHPGEIAWLVSLARPGVALVTNAGPAHLEGFGSLEGVARAKGEIFAGLPADGIAVINADDAYAPLWRELAAGRRIVSFGLRQPADVSAEWQATGRGSRLRVHTPAGDFETDLPLPGEHNVMNALAATAAALAAGVSPQNVARGLAGVRAAPGRLQIRPGPAGSTLIDDTYNANPASLAAALRVLQTFPGRHLLALGDMGELGPEAEALHAEAGRLAREAGVARLVAVGSMAAAAAAAFGPGAERCADRAQAVALLREELGRDDVLLVKGSRASRMDEVIGALDGEA